MSEADRTADHAIAVGPTAEGGYHRLPRPDHPAPARAAPDLADRRRRLLARIARIPVVYDFRAADVAAGGQGAPFAPLFHAALARTCRNRSLIVNIGGVANITWLGADGEILACDTGPGNGPLR